MALRSPPPYHRFMTYLVLTRSLPQPQKVLVNMAKAQTVEAAPKGGSRIYIDEGESVIYVEETFERIAAMLGAERA